MSLTTFRFEHRIGGVLTAATSVVMSDAGAAYGARRTDTDVAVVAAGTAMVSTTVAGVYEKTITDPAAGLTYEWVAKVVYAGVTTYWPFTDAGGSDDYAGRYGSRAMLERRFGTANVADRSNTTGGSPPTADADAIQDAVDAGDDDVDGMFAHSPYATPFTTVPDKVRLWSAELAWCRLSDRVAAQQEDVRKDVEAHRKRLNDEMALYAGGLRSFATTPAYRTGYAGPQVQVVDPTLNDLSGDVVMHPSGGSRSQGQREIPGYGVVGQG